MSELKVEIVEIKDVQSHNNAERLELAIIEGWVCVTGKGQFQKGEKAIYIPIDSVLAEETEKIIFANSKIQLDHHRVRTIRIRGKVSQGLLVSLSMFPELAKLPVGTDIAEALGVTKYEPELPSYQQGIPGVKKKKRLENPNFVKYTSISNIKWYSSVFEEGEEIVITEKIHGSNFRVGLLPTSTDTLWKKILKFFNFLPEYQFCWGSHEVQLQHRKNYAGYYGKDIYGALATKYDFLLKLKPGEQVFGELFGSSIQKGYTYGCKEGEHKLVIFDVKVNGEWLNHADLVKWCKERNLPMVPVLFEGKYTKGIIEKYTSGPSILAPTQSVKEGVVIKPIIERFAAPGRVILKSINSDYLLMNQSEFH